MKYSHRLSDAIHILAYIVICKDDNLSSIAIARSINSNPSLVRRLMTQLTKNNLLTTQQGIANPILVSKPQDISLLDIYTAINPDENLLHVDTTTNQKCPIGSNISPVLNDTYNRIQLAAEKEMRKISLADITDELLLEINKV